MLLLSVKSGLEMLAELAPIGRTLQSKEKPLSFALQNEFNRDHRINVILEDKQRQLAVFLMSD